MYLLAFYTPETHLEKIKTALFNAGAGQLGSYSHCCWQTQGMGQFKPLAESQPHIGQHNVVATLIEWKVEVVIDDGRLDTVMDAFFSTHPYEQPAYQLLSMLDYPKVGHVS